MGSVRPRRSRAVCLSIMFLAVALVASGAGGAILVRDLGGDQFEVVFTLDAPSGTQAVFLAGSFNGWDPQGTAMTRVGEGNRFTATVILAKGRYEYKFVLDRGEWLTDPDNPHRTSGYQNAIVYAGTEPDATAGADTAVDTGEKTPAVRMAATVAHPEPLTQLYGQLGKEDPSRRGPMIDAWFVAHPMPLYSEKALTFVYFDLTAEAVSLQIDSHGARTGYEVALVKNVPGLFAVSLDRSAVPERAAYVFEVTRADTVRRIVDPRAWSVTSRSGHPAGWVVEASPDRGRIELIREVAPSAGALQPRDLYVYLPPGYGETSARRYPVLYMHDGQNCWDDPTEPFGHGGWCVNLAADKLVSEGKISPFIAVGIPNTPERMAEYGPGPDILDPARQAYLCYLRDDVKPLIDRRYRTHPAAQSTSLMGSSMGGVVSFQGALLMPDVFGQAACLSPAFRFRDAQGKGYADLLAEVGRISVRIYLDNGTAGPGNDGAPDTRQMAQRLQSLGWRDGEDFQHFEDAGAMHNERAWRSRVQFPLVFLYGH